MNYIDPNMIVLTLTALATAVMAASAATQAVRFEFDLFGATFLGVITAIGGGTFRDLLIGATPVFWLSDPIYIFTAVPVSAVVFFLVKNMAVGTGRRLKLLAYLDAVGLGLFTLVGVQVSLSSGVSAEMAIILGCITGIGGGMLRDILCGVTPIVLKKDIYATLSLVGGGLYLLARSYIAEEISIVIAFLFIAVVRILIVARNSSD